MNVTQLTEAVQLGLKDPSITDDVILAALNRAVGDVAASHPLPLLKAEDTLSVPAGVLSVSLPADYHHDLWWVYSSTTNHDLPICVNHRALENEYFDRKTWTGHITHVAVEEGLLYVRPIPSVDETLEVKYYRQPTELEETTDVPSVIPDELHQGLLADLALSHFYDAIEDGVDGAKTNTQHYHGRYLEALAKLQKFYPRPTKQRPFVRRRPRYF